MVRKPLILALLAPLLFGAVDLRSDLDARLLAAHNRERTGAGVPPLRWNARLAAEAEVWAAHLVETRSFDHAGSIEDGENLWMGTRGAYSPEAMIGLWIDEKRAYRPGPFPTTDPSAVGHYTQLMWRTTREVGCAVAAGSEDDVLVCRYAEPGNVIGEKPF